MLLQTQRTHTTLLSRTHNAPTRPQGPHAPLSAPALKQTEDFALVELKDPSTCFVSKTT